VELRGASADVAGQNAAQRIDALLRIRHYAALQMGLMKNADW
jgi:hypothetical protein